MFIFLVNLLKERNVQATNVSCFLESVKLLTDESKAIVLVLRVGVYLYQRSRSNLLHFSQKVPKFDERVAFNSTPLATKQVNFS